MRLQKNGLSILFVFCTVFLFASVASAQISVPVGANDTANDIIDAIVTADQWDTGDFACDTTVSSGASLADTLVFTGNAVPANCGGDTASVKLSGSVGGGTLDVDVTCVADAIQVAADYQGSGSVALANGANTRGDLTLTLSRTTDALPVGAWDNWAMIGTIGMILLGSVFLVVRRQLG